MKRVFRVSLAFIYLAVLVISLIILFKPGASFFYLKSIIASQSVIRDGNAFEVPFRVNRNLFNPDSVMILEDQKVLGVAPTEAVMSEGNGTFGIRTMDGDQISILFSSSDNSDVATNGHTYRIYIRPYLISSNLGGISVLILFAGLGIFFANGFLDPRKRKILFGSPFGIVKLWLEWFDRPIRNQNAPKPKFNRKHWLAWKQTAVEVILVSYFYVLMEWLFLITRSSFMDNLNIGEKIVILILTGCAVSLLSLLSLPIFILFDILFTALIPALRKYSHHIPVVFLVTCLSLILLDNFTYTVFKFGIVGSKYLIRVLYGLVWVGFFLYVLRNRSAQEKTKKPEGLQQKYALGVVGLLVISLIFAGVSFKDESAFSIQSAQSISANKKYNIIFFSTDGLNAKNMSVYGYERATTPFINELAKTSLISENNFTNSGHTLGTTTAILTGKSPFTTHVLYTPDTLKGDDKYQHLPGILKLNGYRTVQLGTPYYVDANATNFEGAFDTINCENNPSDTLFKYLSKYGYDNEVYLLTSILGRISDRLAHIFFIKDMENPFSIVTESVSNNISDQERLSCLRSSLQAAWQSNTPVFAQIHLMGTHGDRFFTTNRVFSENELQTDHWMPDFYDDAIRDFDSEVASFVQFLKEHGQYDHTILVLYTDHGQKYETINRLPLIIHFPDSQNAGEITHNTQLIDVAPTVLDFMGLPKPAWMEGNSLLGNLDPFRLILTPSTDEIENTTGIFSVSEDKLKPPFYQFSKLTVFQCQHFFLFNLRTLSIGEGQVENYVNPCSPDQLDAREMIQQKVGAELTQLGYQLPDNWISK